MCSIFKLSPSLKRKSNAAHQGNPAIFFDPWFSVTRLLELWFSCTQCLNTRINLSFPFAKIVQEKGLIKNISNYS